MDERWKPIVGYEKSYAISDRGRCARTFTYGNQPKPIWKIVAPRKKRDGYVAYHLCQDGEKKDPLAHRLVWIAFEGPIPDGLEINHKNSVRDDNRLTNLELTTRSGNCIYGFRMNGRPAPNNPSPGSKNGSAKLTEDDIPKIFAMAEAGYFQREIAKKFGVSQRAIGRILLGQGWQHIR
jgi:hypothetical protein